MQGKRRQTSTAIIMATILVFMSFAVLVQPSKQMLVSSTSSISDTYPNDDFLIVWQRPNGSDPNFPPKYNANFSGELVWTPSMTMQYYGTRTLQLNCPSAQCIADAIVTFGHRISYSWDEIADPAVFPADCKLLIAFRTFAEACEVGAYARNDSRIIGAWIDDFNTGGTSPAAVEDVSDALDRNAGRHIPLYPFIYEDTEGQPYWLQDPYAWADLNPYIDGAIISCLARTYDVNYYHPYGWYDAVVDMMDMIDAGGDHKTYYTHVYNHHYNGGTYSWDQYAQLLKECARLFHEGLTAGVSMLEAFWTQHNPLSSNYLRNFFYTEFESPGYVSVVDFAAMTVSTTLNGNTVAPALTDLSLLWENNYTFFSRHTQTVRFLGMTGTHVTVKNVLTGDITYLTQTPHWEFVAGYGEKYQVFSFPHSYFHWEGNHYITEETWLDNAKILCEGYLYIGANLHLTNTVIHFGHANYDNAMENHTTPKSGLIVNTTGNYTIEMDNCTLEPVHRTFTWLMDWGLSFVHNAKPIRLKNSTFAGFAGAAKIGGIVFVSDCVFFGHTWAHDPGIESGVYDFPLCHQSSHWYRNTFNVGGMRYATTALALYVAGCYAAGLWRSDGNILVGGTRGLTYSMDYGLGDSYFTNAQIMAGGYFDVMDNKGDYEWPEGYMCNPIEDRYVRLHFPEGETGWGGKSATITSSFRLQSPCSVTGVLKDAIGQAIGTYTGTSITVLNITEVKKTSSTLLQVHPFPWTFTVTSTLPDGYYYAWRSWDTPGLNRSATFDPGFKPWQSDGLTMELQPEDANYVEIVQVNQTVYQGVPMRVHDGRTVDMGDALYAWSNERYLAVPNQIGMNITGAGTVLLNVTAWDADSESVVANWTMSTDEDTEVVVEFSGLQADTHYDLYVDGSRAASARTDSNGTMTIETSVNSTTQEFVLQIGFMERVMAWLGFAIVIGVAGMILAMVALVIFPRAK